MRLWLSLLGCFTSVERTIRRRLASKCHATLPRYDALNALATFPKGLSMGELAALLMVSNGNVTGVIKRLNEAGLVKQFTPERDRRSQVVRLTKKGHDEWKRMQAEYSATIDELFQNLSQQQVDALTRQLMQAQENLEESCSGWLARAQLRITVGWSFGILRFLS